MVDKTIPEHLNAEERELWLSALEDGDHVCPMALLQTISDLRGELERFVSHGWMYFIDDGPGYCCYCGMRSQEPLDEFPHWHTCPIYEARKLLDLENTEGKG